MAGSIKILARSETGSKFDIEISLGARRISTRLQVQDLLDLQLEDDTLLTLAYLHIRRLMQAAGTRDIAVIKVQLEAADLTS